MTDTLASVIYTAHTHTTGGRDGRGQTVDADLDLPLSPPGSGRPGTNPEQLFAIGWSACFIGALRRAGQKLNVRLPADVAVDAEVSLGNTADGGFALAAQLTVHLPGCRPRTRRSWSMRLTRSAPTPRRLAAISKLGS